LQNDGPGISCDIGQEDGNPDAVISLDLYAADAKVLYGGIYQYVTTPAGAAFHVTADLYLTINDGLECELAFSTDVSEVYGKNQIEPCNDLHIPVDSSGTLGIGANGTFLAFYMECYTNNGVGGQFPAPGPDSQALVGMDNVVFNISPSGN